MSSVLALLEQLVALPSVNSMLDATSPGEAAVTDWIEARTKESGLKVSRQMVAADQDNLLIELRGGHTQTLLLEAHLDTVPAGEMHNAFRPFTCDGRLYGRGACDTKGSLAAMLWALEVAAQTPDSLACNVILCCTVDEEHGATGIKKFAELEMPIAGAVTGEPTELQIVIAHKGCVRFAAATRGKAAHSSMPSLGQNAIYRMSELLKFIRETVEPELAAQTHPLCGAPTISVGTIRGGTQINIVPESCDIQVDRRLVPGEDARQTMDELGTRFERVDPTVTLHELLLDPALDTSADAQVVKTARDVAQRLGLSPALVGVPYGSDASKLQDSCGIECIVFGPGSIAQAHSSDEWVAVADVERAAQFYLGLMRSFDRETTSHAEDMGR